MIKELSTNRCKISDCERSEYASFAQERCKRLATVNEVNPLFLRNVK